VNARATAILQANGVRVGLLGARMSDVDRLLQESGGRDDEEEGDEYEDEDGDKGGGRRPWDRRGR
jgi:hypothetical protein